MDIDGETVLIAGGSSGLGAACVGRLLQERANVVIADVKPPANESQREFYCQTDVTDESSVKDAIEFAKNRFGSLRGCVICAGVIHAQRIVGRDGPFDLAEFRRVIEVNLVGTFNVLRLCAAAIQANAPDEEGERGAIVMTASISAMEGQVGQAAYSASKGGVASLTLPAAREFAPLGIRVVTIAPGVFQTPLMDNVNEKGLAVLRDQTLFPPRFGRPEEFAETVLHVLQNPMMNGTVIRLDGGMRMR
ncbi:Levodione reductase [Stieleria maiorica]|uniref:Levodione reductase n=1 Tax=Stieleria maiorica TaxID=2795974 RepID=A0A5B9MJY2_9BACT|nr:SDR family NAD(P)-dependent oxidoreductase [Stieleria maiorica]QEG01582.1 Levodione reductase [Stieleria maiorica]